ncbi:hypothetical protein C1893_07085 [Pseudomonas sp. MPR-ANC1]|uniref:DUF262 domain-containing protein n=1 Tax=Pseudomonas sp. MPR-ANC1 TaxID=2075548 RepID=UPI000CD21B3E|nr:DUF262 domain-containing protein [Pseudomonas sp. MPR-ANC1]POA49379.1 hypothetical protein C1893_07085 [Pseudomonas sp. MPR-ANC1]
MLKEQLEAIQQKAKERTVKTQTVEYDLETLVKKIKRDVIKLNPDYQRNHRWPDSFSSRLIESLILNIPIPIVYISMDVDVDDETEDELARYSVIDGQQRLTAIYNFFTGSYALQSLEVLSELNGSYYKDLPPFLIRRLEERTIRCLRIDSTVDTQVKFDIFERLNSGSVKLEAQELRNATCRGPFKDLIKLLAKNPVFAEIANLDPESTRIKKMEDEELVLRFFAISHNDGYLEYKGQFKKFLTRKMEEFNKLDALVLKEMNENFITTMGLVKHHFGSKPFAKYKKAEGAGFTLMSSFNAAVFDAIACAFSKPNIKKIPSYEDFINLFADPVFFESVEGSVNDVSKLNNRINKAREIIK